MERMRKMKKLTMLYNPDDDGDYILASDVGLSEALALIHAGADAIQRLTDVSGTDGSLAEEIINYVLGGNTKNGN